YPDGKKQTILNVPRYDFNWQLWYDTSIKIPKGTTMKVFAWYDNSAGNKFNRNPNATVYDGDQTWEEMHFPSYGLVLDDISIDPTKVVRNPLAPPRGGGNWRMHHVHFVGSVALDTPEEVFAVIGEHCGPYLKRVPDGEPGGRRLWISWQIPVLRANPSLAQVGEGQIPLKLADGVEPGRIHFGELGYSREARPSYEDFVAARTAGRLPAGVRFQVSLPTPWAVIMPFCRQPDAQQIYPAYEQAMLREVARICKAIPHHDLAIQWDVCIEMLAWDGRWQNAQAFPGMEQVFAGNFARLGAAVPAGVELGFHL